MEGDSPNGKRCARKGRGGEIELAFGFDLTPLVARAAEFEQLAEEVSAEARALTLVRERITLCRRDIVKMIETGIEEGVPTRQPGRPGPADDRTPPFGSWTSPQLNFGRGRGARSSSRVSASHYASVTLPKMIATGAEESVPTCRGGQGPADW